MKKRVIIVGAGGHGKVIADIIEKAEDKVVGFLDDNETGKIFGYDVIGKIADIKKFQYKNNFVIAIGDNYLRKQIAEQNDVEWYTAIHPSVQVAKGVKIGSGTVIMAGSIINSGAKIGRHVIVNTGTIVANQMKLQDQQVKIESLEGAIAKYKEYSSLSSKIAPELMVLYPSVKKISISETVEVDVKTLKPDTVTLAILNLNKELDKEEKIKLEDWLKTRVGAKKFRLILE